jgi:hypothetical protein
MNLYEINKAIEDFDFDIDDETGEILNINDLDQLNLAKDTKIENIALWIKNLKADAEAYKNEKESFYKKEKAAKNKAESLKNYLTYALQGEKFKTDRVTISYRHSDSININDWTLLDSDLLRPQPPVPDKTAIRKAIQDGRIVDGAEIVEKKSIQIK